MTPGLVPNVRVTANLGEAKRTERQRALPPVCRTLKAGDESANVIHVYLFVLFLILGLCERHHSSCET